jgi:5-carboxymethyl-2-hydroxymuconate isomerase
VPHLIVEYSANIENEIALSSLLDKLYDTAIASGIFPLGGIRLRAFRADHYRIADRHPDNGYVHITALVGHGRPLDVRERVAKQLFETVTRHLADFYDRSPLALSLTMEEFDPVTNLKQNNLHEYVKKRRQ